MMSFFARGLHTDATRNLFLFTHARTNTHAALYAVFDSSVPTQPYPIRALVFGIARQALADAIPGDDNNKYRRRLRVEVDFWSEL